MTAPRSTRARIGRTCPDLTCGRSFVANTPERAAEALRRHMTAEHPLAEADEPLVEQPPAVVDPPPLGGGNSSPDPADWPVDEQPAWTGTEGDGPEPAPNLPVPLGDSSGQLDLDTLRGALPQVRDGLVLGLRQAATAMRQARGTVVTAEDTYPLVRRLTEADEVLGQWSRAFADAAKEARALIEEDALSVPGAEADGMLVAGLYVPDGAGRRIAVRADYKSGTSTWDVPSLVGWLVDDEVADRDAVIRNEQQHGDTAWGADDAREVARNVVDRLLALGNFSPAVAKIKALRTKLAEAQRDAEAAVIAQVRSVGPREYLGVKVTREDTPGGAA